MSTIILALAALVPSQPSASGGNLPPTLSFERVPYSGRIRVDAVDPEGGRLTLRLRNPPPGTFFAPVIDRPSPVSGEIDLTGFRWGATLTEELRFEAIDAQGARAELRVPISSSIEERFLIADVTGNGTPDVIGLASDADVDGVVDAGEIYLWADRPQPAGAPTARLRLADPLPGEGLSEAPPVNGQPFVRGVELVDVDGDGVRDLLARSRVPRAASNGMQVVFHVWRGGPALQGTLKPDAALVAPAQGVGATYLFDATGDGRPELVAEDRVFCDPTLFLNRVQDVFLWSPPFDADGEVPPRAILSAGRSQLPTSTCGFAALTSFETDLTGDGIVDVVLQTTMLDQNLQLVGTTAHVWRGGEDLTGRVSPSTRLFVPGADNVRAVPDVTGDGVADLVALHHEVGTQLVADVFAGGALSAPPVARLQAPAPQGSPTAFFFAIGADDLDEDGSLDLWTVIEGAGNGVLYWSGATPLRGDVDATLLAPLATVIGDVDEDGTADYLAFTLDPAEIELRLGGPDLPTQVGPTSVLRVPVLSGSNRRLGPSPWLGDVTGDGVLDVVSGEELFAFFPPPVPVTEIHVWAGPIAPGVVPPTASLNVPLGPVPPAEAQLTLRALADVTGDGVADVIAERTGADETWVWRGGATLDPLPVARLLGGSTGEVEIGDLTGDGILDVALVLPNATVQGQPGAGAIRVWAGGPTLVGDVAPLVELVSPRPMPGDGLGFHELFAASSTRLYDLDGDGVLDVVAAASEADVRGKADVGALFHWAGPIGPAGEADGALFVPDATPGDGLAR